MKKYTSLLLLLLCAPSVAMAPSSPPSDEGFFAELRPLVSDNLDKAEPNSSPTPFGAYGWESQEHEHVSTSPIFRYSPGKVNPESPLPKADSPKASPKAKKGHAEPSSRAKKQQKTTKIHKMHLCKECNTSFDNRSELKSHGLLHIKESRPFPCPHRLCTYGTSTKQLLDQHMRKSHKILADSETAQAVRAKAAAQAAALEPLIRERLTAQKPSRLKKRAAPDTPRDESGRFERSCQQGCGLVFSSAKEYVEHSLKCMSYNQTNFTPESFKKSAQVPLAPKKFKDVEKTAPGRLT